jgi:hypothetical protein
LKKQLEACTRELAEARGHLSEALEQQAATSEVLRVISSSPGELEPVFQAMLANAVRICNAKFGNLFLYEGNSFRIAAQRNAPPARKLDSAIMVMKSQAAKAPHVRGKAELVADKIAAC